MANEIQATSAATNTVAQKTKKEAKKELKDKAKNIYQEAAELSKSYNEIDVRNDVKDSVKKDYENKTGAFAGLSDKEAKELYKQVRKQAGFGFWRRNFAPTKKDAYNAFNKQAKANKEELDATAEDFYLKAMHNTVSTTAKGVRREVKIAIEGSDLSKAEKASALKQVKRGNWGRQFLEWTGDIAKKDATKDFKAQAAVNRKIITKTALEDGTKKLSAESQATLDKMGLTYTQAYEIGDKEFGAEATDSYSNKKKQVGENVYIMRSLRKASEAAGKEFDVKPEEAENLYRELGYDIDPKYFTGHAVGGAIKGAGIGASGFINFVNQDLTQKVVAPAGVGVSVKNEAEQTVIPVGVLTTAVGAAAGTAVAINKDIKRVEDRIAEKELPKDITTYEQYAKYIDGESQDARITAKGARIMKGIASHFTNEDGTLKAKEMNEALDAAAGDNSVLNYQEARILYSQLLNKPVEEEPVDETPVNEEPVNEEPVEQNDCETQDLGLVPDKVHCRDIKKGDGWQMLKALYNINNDADLKALVREEKDKYYEAHKAELSKKGIKSSKGNFFVKDEWCLRDKVVVNGHEYTYTDSEDYDKVSRYGKTVSVDGSIERNIFGSMDCQGNIHRARTQKEAHDAAERANEEARKEAIAK